MKRTLVSIAVSTLALAACSKSADSGKAPGGTVTASQASQSASDNGCKDFPAPLYPTTTSVSCDQSGDRYTASIETADSVDQVTHYYLKQVQSSGWEPAPEPLISPTHTVVTIKKGPGHAVISTFVGASGKGCSYQINVFPKGN